jgi:arylsulfatase A-like enzyme
MTGQFGKNHLGDRDEHVPTAHGFDEFFGNLYHLNAEEHAVPCRDVNVGLGRRRGRLGDSARSGNWRQSGITLNFAAKSAEAQFAFCLGLERG